MIGFFKSTARGLRRRFLGVELKDALEELNSGLSEQGSKLARLEEIVTQVGLGAEPELSVREITHEVAAHKERLDELNHKLVWAEERFLELNHQVHDLAKKVNGLLDLQKLPESTRTWSHVRRQVEDKDRAQQAEYINRYWEELARADYRHTILAGFHGTDEEFYLSGAQLISELNDRYKLFDPSKAVLDVGCGAGRLALALVGKVKRYIGVDVSETMLQKARERVSDPAFQFIQSNGRSLEAVQTNSIDTLFSFLVLQHMPSAVMAQHFEEFSRVISPEGRLVFQLPLPGTYPEEREHEGQLWVAQAYEKERVSDELSRLGFSLEDYFTQSNGDGGPVDQFFLFSKV